jgi:arylsulfatase A-like enzyme
VPFIVRWPGRVKPGVSDALMCQVDLPATLAAVAGVKFDTSDAPDSEVHLEALLNESATGRQFLVEHAGSLALRDAGWKLIPASKGPKRNNSTNTELGNDAGAQLYVLTADPGETRNVAAENPGRVAAMLRKLDEIKARGTVGRDGGP